MLEEREDQLLQEVYEKVEEGLLETEIQPLIRVWLEAEEGLSYLLKAEYCCEREEGEGQPEMVWTVLLWVERSDEQAERPGEGMRSGKVVEVDGALKELQEEEREKLFLQEVVGGVGEE